MSPAEICSTEDLLLKIHYILQELYRNDSLDETLIRDYFSADTLSQLSDAIQSIHLPAEDTFFECNELLQDLAVNYQGEKLYCDFLNPIFSSNTLFTLKSPYLASPTIGWRIAWK